MFLESPEGEAAIWDAVNEKLDTFVVPSDNRGAAAEDIINSMGLPKGTKESLIRKSRGQVAPGLQQLPEVTSVHNTQEITHADSWLNNDPNTSISSYDLLPIGTREKLQTQKERAWDSGNELAALEQLAVKSPTEPLDFGEIRALLEPVLGMSPAISEDASDLEWFQAVRQADSVSLSRGATVDAGLQPARATLLDKLQNRHGATPDEWLSSQDYTLTKLGIDSVALEGGGVLTEDARNRMLRPDFNAVDRQLQEQTDLIADTQIGDYVDVAPGPEVEMREWSESLQKAMTKQVAERRVANQLEKEAYDAAASIGTPTLPYDIIAHVAGQDEGFGKEQLHDMLTAGEAYATIQAMLQQRSTTLEPMTVTPEQWKVTSLDRNEGPIGTFRALTETFRSLGDASTQDMRALAASGNRLNVTYKLGTMYNDVLEGFDEAHDFLSERSLMGRPLTAAETAPAIARQLEAWDFDKKDLETQAVLLETATRQAGRGR